MQIDDATAELANALDLADHQAGQDQRRPVRQHALAENEQDGGTAGHANTHQGSTDAAYDLSTGKRMEGAPNIDDGRLEPLARSTVDPLMPEDPAIDGGRVGNWPIAASVELEPATSPVPYAGSPNALTHAELSDGPGVVQILENRQSGAHGLPADRDGPGSSPTAARDSGPIAPVQDQPGLLPDKAVPSVPEPEIPTAVEPPAVEPVPATPDQPEATDSAPLPPAHESPRPAAPETPSDPPEPAPMPPPAGPPPTAAEPVPEVPAAVPEVPVEVVPTSPPVEPTAEPAPPINHAPELVAPAYVMAEDTSLTIRAADLLAGAVDADGDQLEVARVVGPDGTGLTAQGDGTWLVQPAADWHGTLDLTYEVSDGRGGLATATARVVVEDVAEKLDLVTKAGERDASGDQILHIVHANPTPVEVSWEVPGSDRRGTLIATPGDTSFTIPGLDHGEVRIATGGILQDSASFDLANPRLDLHGAATVEEGDAGVRYVTYTVTLDQAVNRPVDVVYDVRQSGSNTATLGEDVQAAGGRLTMAAGQTSATFQVAVYGDQAFEGDQAYKVQLRTASPDVDLGVTEVVTTIVEGQDDVALRSAIHVEFSQFYSPDIDWNDERLDKWQADGPRAEWGIEQAYAGGKAELSYADAQTMHVESQGWNVMKAVHVESTESGKVSIGNFVYADVALGDGGDSDVVVQDVKRGHVDTGDGNDRITVGLDTNSSDTAYNTVQVASGGGDDRVSLTGDRDGGINGAAKAGSVFIVDAGSGADQVTVDGGKYASATLSGDGGDDRLAGGTGRDTLLGGVGNDHLTGAANADKLDGGAGSDMLAGGAGNDQLMGGAGDDVFVFGRGDGRDQMDGGTGWVDSIQLHHPEGAGPVGDWTLAISRGSIEHADDGLITLSQDSAGSIKLADGSEVMFTGMEQIQF